MKTQTQTQTKKYCGVYSGHNLYIASDSPVIVVLTDDDGKLDDTYLSPTVARVVECDSIEQAEAYVLDHVSAAANPPIYFRGGVGEMNDADGFALSGWCRGQTLHQIAARHDKSITFFPGEGWVTV